MNYINIKTFDFSGSDYTAKTDPFSFVVKDVFLNEKAVAYVLRWQLCKKRSGSASTKLMSEISGTTAKPYKQKGTGRARQGSKRSVQFRGGRACFGPRPRSYYFRIPKAIIKSSVFDLLRLKIKQGKMLIFNGKLNTKTSLASKFMKDNNLGRLLLVAGRSHVDLAKSFRNIKNVKIVNEESLNIYDMLNFEFVMLSEECFKNIKRFL